MQIKKTRILHKRYTADKWLDNTLRQGEIGFLLSDDKQKILDMRIGYRDIEKADGTFNGLPFEDCLTINELCNIYEYTDSEVKKLLLELEKVTNQVTSNTESIKNLDNFEDTDTTYEILPDSNNDGSLIVRVFSKSSNTFINEYPVTIPGWNSIVDIALGRTKSEVFDNRDDPDYINKIATKDYFKIGDIIYFRDTEIPDLWVSSVYETLTDGSYYEFSNVKTSSPDLVGYETVEHAEQTYLTKTELANLNTDSGEADNQFVTSVKQTGGKVTVKVKHINIDEKISTKCVESLQQSQQYTESYVEERLGTELVDNGTKVSVTTFVNNKLNNVRTSLSNEISNVSTRVSENTSAISTLNSKIDSLITITETHTTQIDNLTTRVTSLENLDFSGGGSGTVVNGISNIIVNGVTLPKNSVDNSVEISEISTDLLVKGKKQLIFDGNQLS